MDPYDIRVAREEEVPDLARKPMLPNGMILFMDLFLVLVSFFWAFMTACMCGHLDWTSAVVIIPAFLILVLLAIRGSRNHRLERYLNYLSLLVMILPVGKTISDILWNGHVPLLR